MDQDTIGPGLNDDALSQFCSHAPDATLIVASGRDRAQATIIACNAFVCELYGYSRAELIGQPFALVYRPQDAATAEHAIAEAQDTGSLHLETVHCCKDGQALEVELALTYITDGSERVVVVIRDITTAKRTERRLTAQHTLSRILTETQHFMDAAPRILQIIGGDLGWDLGTMWCLEDNRLHWTIGWYASPAVAAFEATNRRLTFARGIGLPGRVWATGEPCWLDSLDTDPVFPRHAEMRALGLKSALAFPIRSRSGFFGVIEFFSCEARLIDAEMLAMAATVGNQSGAYIERRRAEQATRFQAHLLDNVEQAVIATDLDGRITYWNRFAEQLYGQTATRAVGRNVTEIIPVPALPGVVETIMTRMRAGESWSGEFIVPRSDGTSFPVQTTEAPIYDEQSRLVGIVGVSVDISERKRSEERLHFLAEASALLSGSLDAETTLADLCQLAVPRFADWCSINLLDAQDTLVRIAGHHSDPAKEGLLKDLLRHKPLQLAHLRSIPAHGRPDAIVIADICDERLADTVLEAEQLALYRSAGFRSVMIVPLYTNEQMAGIMLLATCDAARRYGRDDSAVAEDLAHRVALALENMRLYKDAQAAIRTRDDFLSIAAHELKTPVTSLMGYSQMLQRRLEGLAGMSERDLRALRVIRGQAEHLAKLVASLLDVSRIETGHFALDCQPLDLCALVRAQVEGAQSSLDRHTLTYHCPGAPLMVEGDAMRLEQVLQNLIQNAIKYSPNGGPITLWAEQQNELAVFSVSDRGIGIPHSSLNHLFERFFRAPNVSASSAGVGIGLYVVKEIVEQHGGSITIATVEGEGSTFTISLPLASQAAPPYTPTKREQVDS